jgi:hypothetical protein
MGGSRTHGSPAIIRLSKPVSQCSQDKMNSAPLKVWSSHAMIDRLMIDWRAAKSSLWRMGVETADEFPSIGRFLLID